jgi:hypothetical protein
MGEGGTGWSDAKKWIAGIVASVIVALVVFLATMEGGFLNPSRPTPVPPAQRPDIAISEFDLPFVVSGGENVVAEFTISNEGNAVARGCVLRGDVSPVGDEFSVGPNSFTRVAWGVRSFGLSGNVQFSAYVLCDNAISETATRQTTVFR